MGFTKPAFMSEHHPWVVVVTIAAATMSFLVLSTGNVVAQEQSATRGSIDLAAAIDRATSQSGFGEGAARPLLSDPPAPRSGGEAPRFAAQDDPSRWGVGFSFVPQWKAIDSFVELWDGPDEIDIDGFELRAGFVRGQNSGGHWGVSFVAKPVKDGSTLSRSAAVDFFGDGNPVTLEDVAVADGVSVIGVQWEGFTPFATIGDRVQIGVTYGAGVGKWRGNYQVVTQNADFVFDEVTGDVSTVITEERLTVPAEEIWSLPVVPLGRFEAAVAVTLAPGAKVMASGGFNFPGTQFISFGFVYLIGS